MHVIKPLIHFLYLQYPDNAKDLSEIDHLQFNTATWTQTPSHPRKLSKPDPR